MGKTYDLELHRPKEDKVPYICKLTFSAPGGDFGDIVQAGFPKKTINPSRFLIQQHRKIITIITVKQFLCIKIKPSNHGAVAKNEKKTAVICTVVNSPVANERNKRKKYPVRYKVKAWQPDRQELTEEFLITQIARIARVTLETIHE